MEFRDLLSVIAKDDRREEFAELAQRLHALHAADPTGRAVTAEADRRDLLTELRHQLRLHLRAARHPIPSDDELEAMIARHFDSGT